MPVPDRARVGVSHPALRYVTPGDGWEVAHRVHPGSLLSVCGLPGGFVQAGAEKALCPVCYRAVVKGPATNTKVR